MKVSSRSSRVAPPKHHHQAEADPEHGVHLAVAMPDPGDLRDGGDDHHGRGDIDVEGLEGDKETG
jgi:hypothetical protein